MTRLSKLQSQTLRLLADCPEGAPASDAWVAVIESLVKRGLVVATKREDGPDHITITAAGEAIHEAKATGVGPNKDCAVITSVRKTSPKNASSSVAPTHRQRRREMSVTVDKNEPLIAAPPGQRTVDARQGPKANLAHAATREPKGKVAALLALLRQAGGTTVAEMMTTTGWQAHSVRGALSGEIKRKLGLTVLSSQSVAGRVYLIPLDGDA